MARLAFAGGGGLPTPPLSSHLRHTVGLEAPFVIKIRAVRQFLTDFHYFFFNFSEIE